MSFMVMARRWISSRALGTGTRRSSRSSPIVVDLAPDPLDRRRARVTTTQVVPPTTSRSSGTPTSSSGTSAAVDSSTSSSDAATRTTYSCVAALGVLRDNDVAVVGQLASRAQHHVAGLVGDLEDDVVVLVVVVVLAEAARQAVGLDLVGERRRLVLG